MIADQQILDLADAIAQAFSPEQIILFGSYAYGSPNEDSDVDLLVVMPFEGKSRDKSLAIWKAVRPRISVDLIVRQPADVARRYEQWDPLIREALDKGRVLYERDRARVAGESGRRLARRSA